MDPGQYLGLARERVARAKAAGPGFEAQCRSAISRAYYSVFHLTLEFLEFIDIKVTDSGQCHVAVQYALNNSGVPDLTSAQVRLRSLYGGRKSADYRMADRLTERVSYAESMIQVADKTVALLDKCRQNFQSDAAQKTAATNTILAWAKQAGQERNLWRK